MEKQFLKVIIYYAEKIYEAAVVDLDTEQERMDMDVVPVAGGSGSTEVVVKQFPAQEQIDYIKKIKKGVIMITW